jgi:hypothetical protein
MRTCDKLIHIAQDFEGSANILFGILLDPALMLSCVCGVDILAGSRPRSWSGNSRRREMIDLASWRSTGKVDTLESGDVESPKPFTDSIPGEALLKTDRLGCAG